MNNRETFTRREILEVLTNSDIFSSKILLIMESLPSGKRDQTKSEERLNLELRTLGDRLDEAVRYLSFWKDHAHLIQNKSIEERIAGQVFELSKGIF